MNMFFSGVSDKVTLGVLNRLIEYYKPEKCYVTYAKTDDYKKIDGCTVAEAYSHTDIRYTGVYNGYIYEKDCPPIDETLLNSMSQHESTIIKMMERKYVRQFDPHPPPDYEERVRVYHRHLRYWNYVLDAAQIKLAVFIRIPHEVFDYIMYCLCKMKGITVATAREGPIRGFTYFMSDIYDYYPGIQSVYLKAHNELKDVPIEDVSLPTDMERLFNFYCERTNNKSPFYVRHIKPKVPSTGRLLVKIMSRLIKSIKHNLFTHELKIGRRDLINHPKRRRLYNAYDRLSIAPDLTKRYIYFPLQYQPELSTSPVGGVFVHQMLAIKMISYYLPNGVSIYVKEHPMQDPYCREPQMYHDLTELPNVKLVNRDVDSYELVKNCIAVASSTGLAGFEGLFIDKPFLMFGSTIVMYAPGTFVVRNNEDCAAALSYILENGAKHTLKDMKIFMNAISDYVKCCDYDRGDDYDKMGIARPTEKDKIDRHYEGYKKVIDEQLNKV